MVSRLSKLMENGHYYFPIDGHFVSQQQIDVAKILKDYNPELELQWIPPDDRGPDDHPFRVVHRPSGRPPYVVLTAQEADARLLARVWSMDQRTGHGGRGNLLNWLDKYNDAVQAMNLKRQMEERAEDHAIAHAAISSQKIHYKVKNPRTGELLDFGKPFGGRFG